MAKDINSTINQIFEIISGFIPICIALDDKIQYIYLDTSCVKKHLDQESEKQWEAISQGKIYETKKIEYLSIVFHEHHMTKEEFTNLIKQLNDRLAKEKIDVDYIHSERG